MIRKASLVAACWCALLLTGCASYTDLPAGTVKQISGSAVLEQQDVYVPPQLEAHLPSADYRIGSGDVLFININGRSEVGSPGAASGNNAVQGSRVDGTGNIHLPMIGAVPVAGLTVSEVQTLLRERFSAYFNEPWVIVEIAEYKSQPLYLIGQFRTAGTYYMERPLNLLQGLALGGGLLDTANLRSARLIRDGQILPVDIFRLLRQGATEQNHWLKSGDTLYVPDDKNQNVFVFGAVKKPGPVAMPNGSLSLAQALSAAGIDGASDNEKNLRIIRSHSVTRGELIVLDLERVIRGEVMPYPLMEGDIVYVPRSAIGNWNQALSEMLPSLQTVSAVLQPFVQIQYLKD
ncbi:MAG: polysaccharide biosynthesis/export family protein [Desulfuromonadales bacterium]|nr:polysaccharide biosynthesis/export family protein [Desulfuromonadales bacterium]